MNEIMNKEKTYSISITKTKESKLPKLLKYLEHSNEIPFGSMLSDHMFYMDYDGNEWGNFKIIPVKPIQMLPSSMVLHYGQAVFEGMKGYYVSENQINLFRPEKHFERLVSSCKRMCIPPPCPKLMTDALRQLVGLDHKWAPKNPELSLYIRPVIYASEECVAARESKYYRCYVVTFPVSRYYGGDPSSTHLITSATMNNYVRAFNGGTGNVKAAGNYSATFYPAQQAYKAGYRQILWLDALNQKYIEEVGTMNIFFCVGDSIITPKLSGTILPGITRNSILELLRARKYNVEERSITIDEIVEAHNKGILKEVFGCGTATVVTSVGSIQHKEHRMECKDKAYTVAQEIHKTLTDIQFGRSPDIFNWISPVHIPSK